MNPAKSMTGSHAEESLLRRSIRDRSAVCAVVGLGYIGVTVLKAIDAAGFRVYGFDRSLVAINRASEKLATARSWSLGQDEAPVEDADIVCLAVRIEVDPEGSFDLESIRSAAQIACRSNHRPRLVLVHSTLPMGATRRLFAQTALRRQSARLFVAHCPERLQVNNPQWNLRNIPHLVGGLNKPSTQLATEFVSTLCDCVIPVSAPEVSELSKLLENAFMTTNIALVGEITKLAHGTGISASEVTRAAATKPFGYHPFHPGAGIGGHCLPNDLKLLKTSQRAAGLDPSFIDCVARSASALPETAVAYLETILTERGGRAKGGQILLIGIGFKIGAHDQTDSPAIEFVRLLRERGAIPVYFDSYNADFVVDGIPVTRTDLAALSAGKRLSAGIILAGDAALDMETLESSVDVLLDTGGGRVMSKSDNAYVL